MAHLSCAYWWEFRGWSARDGHAMNVRHGCCDGRAARRAAFGRGETLPTPLPCRCPTHSAPGPCRSCRAHGMRPRVARKTPSLEIVHIQIPCCRIELLGSSYPASRIGRYTHTRLSSLARRMAPPYNVIYGRREAERVESAPAYPFMSGDAYACCRHTRCTWVQGRDKGLSSWKSPGRGRGLLVPAMWSLSRRTAGRIAEVCQK